MSDFFNSTVPTCMGPCFPTLPPQDYRKEDRGWPVWREPVNRVPVADSVRVPILRGVSPCGYYSPSRAYILSKARALLLGSGRIFHYENSVVILQEAGKGCHLQNLKIDGKVVLEAENILANIFVCEQKGIKGRKPRRQFSPPAKLIKDLLHDNTTCAAIPRMRLYSKRLVFDKDFRLCAPGWNAASGIYVAAPAVTINPNYESGAQEDPMPPHLTALLADFAFRSNTDRLHALALLLTGVLANHFITAPKPVVLLDGNQPGVGKTLLVQVLGAVLDGFSPSLMNYTPEQESLEKKIGAIINSCPQSVLLFDNCKPRTKEGIDSPVIESLSLAPMVSVRMLGQSSQLQRPNIYIWAITMNDTAVSRDAVQRALPIRLFYEGNPQNRDLGGRDPLQYALDHRFAILAELANMVALWQRRGQRRSSDIHRCQEWAQIIGGILAANGFTGFLENLEVTAGEFNSTADELQSLLETILQNGPSKFVVAKHPQQCNPPPVDPGGVASEWIPFFEAIEPLKRKYEGISSSQGKSSRIGNYLSAHLNAAIPCQFEGRTTSAQLRKREARANQKRYYFEIILEPAEEKFLPINPLLPGVDSRQRELQAVGYSARLFPFTLDGLALDRKVESETHHR